MVNGESASWLNFRQFGSCRRLLLLGSSLLDIVLIFSHAIRSDLCRHRDSLSIELIDTATTSCLGINLLPHRAVTGFWGEVLSAILRNVGRADGGCQPACLVVEHLPNTGTNVANLKLPSAVLNTESTLSAWRAGQ